MKNKPLLHLIGVGVALLTTMSSTSGQTTLISSALSFDAMLLARGPCIEPLITTQPQSQTVCTGASVTLSVGASGTTRLDYQWYFNDSILAGASGNTFSRSPALSADDGSYFVIVTNECGSVTSQVARLTVESAPYPSGADVVVQARALTAPIGVGASALFAQLRTNLFETNRIYSDNWIRSQLAFYDAADLNYRQYLCEMVEGGGDSILGMRRWLSNPANVAFWDNAVRRNVGDGGYARIVALNGAFAPGSQAYELSYGGVRRYDSVSNLFLLNGTSFAGPGTQLVQFPGTVSGEERFDILVRFGGAVREQMYNFYNAFLAGGVTQPQVSAFNEIYVLVSGCALASTDVPTTGGGGQAARYLAGLNLMAGRLLSLGFQVQTPFPTGAEVVQIVRGYTMPIGVKAVNIFPTISNTTLGQKVILNKHWTRDQISAYDNATADYRSFLTEFIDGPFGMRTWFADYDDPTPDFWNQALNRTLGGQAFARLIGQFLAYPAGGDEFRFVYGGSRVYNAMSNIFMFQGTQFPGVALSNYVVRLGPQDTTYEQMYPTLIQFSGAIVTQIYRFHQAFLDGQLTQAQVSDFNEAIVLTGGCSLADSPTTGDGVMAAMNHLNRLALTLGRLGFPVFVVNGDLTGNVNGMPLNASLLALGDPDTGHASLQASGIGPEAAGLTFAINTVIICFFATEQNGALSLLSLTGGNYSRQYNYSFDTGQQLTATQTVTRVSSNQFATSVVLNGTVPHLGPTNYFQLEDFADDLVQINPTTLRYTVNRRFLADLDEDGVAELHTVTGTIDVFYDGIPALPFPERLLGTHLQTSYDAASLKIQWAQDSTMQVPAHALTINGNLTGNVNGRPLNASLFAVGDPGTGHASLQASGLGPDSGSDLRWWFSISGGSGFMAMEQNGALNLISLTSGNHTQQTSLSFTSGEHLTATETFTRVSSNQFALSMILDGTVPHLGPTNYLQPLDFAEDVVQINATALRYTINRRFLADLNDDGVPELVINPGTSDVFYDGIRPLPFSQRLVGTELQTSYDAASLTIYHEQDSVMLPAATTVTVSGNLTGNINGLPLNASLFGVGDPGTGHASLQASPVGQDSGPDARWWFVIAGGSGIMAAENGGALNLVSLTGGNYSQQANLTFSSGEHFTVTQTVARVSSNQFAISMVINGTVPHFGPMNSFEPLNFTDDLVQVNSTTLLYTVNRPFLANRTWDVVPPDPYTVTGTIEVFYDGVRPLPFPQRLVGTNLQVSYEASNLTIYEAQDSTILPAATTVTVSGNLTGNINGLPLNASLFGVGDPGTGHASLQASPVGQDSGPDARWWFVIAGGSGIMAAENGGALNLVSLTGGNYSQQASLTFSSGEHFTVTQTVARVSSNQFAISMVINGTVPHFGPMNSFEPLNFTDDLVQVNSTTLLYTVNRPFLANRTWDVVPPDPYTVTGTIEVFYDGVRPLPFPQRLVGTNLQVSYEASNLTIYEAQDSVMLPAPSVFSLTANLTPLNTAYLSEPNSGPLAFANGVLLEDTEHIVSDDPHEPPALGETTLWTSGSTAVFRVSTNGGAIYFPVSTTGTTSVKARNVGTSGGATLFATELTLLDLRGGGLPPGMLVRESPALASTGQTVLRPVPGGYRVSSYFDLNLELSLDQGQHWSPADRPLHVVLSPRNSCTTPTNCIFSGFANFGIGSAMLSLVDVNGAQMLRIDGIGNSPTAGVGQNVPNTTEMHTTLGLPNFSVSSTGAVLITHQIGVVDGIPDVRFATFTVTNEGSQLRWIGEWSEIGATAYTIQIFLGSTLVTEQRDLTTGVFTTPVTDVVGQDCEIAPPPKLTGEVPTALAFTIPGRGEFVGDNYAVIAQTFTLNPQVQTRIEMLAANTGPLFLVDEFAVNKPREFHWAGNPGSPQPWTLGANWQEGDFPNSSNHAAFFGDVISQDTMITLATDVTSRGLTFASQSHIYEVGLAGGGDIRLDAAGTGRVTFQVLTPQEVRLCGGMPVEGDGGLHLVTATGATLVLSGNIGKDGKPPGILLLGSANRGTVVLSGSNNIRDEVQVFSGTLRLASSTTIPDNVPLIVAGDGRVLIDAGVTERVAALIINGVSLPPGTYGSSTPPLQGPGFIAVGSAPPALDISADGSLVTIRWSGNFILQQTATLNGPTIPWTDVPGNVASPYTLQATAQVLFFRLRQ